jgi:hypothetical protein
MIRAGALAIRDRACEGLCLCWSGPKRCGREKKRNRQLHRLNSLNVREQSP